jgi:hypothetical protein
VPQVHVFIHSQSDPSVITDVVAHAIDSDGNMRQVVAGAVAQEMSRGAGSYKDIHIALDHAMAKVYRPGGRFRTKIAGDPSW